MILQIVGYKNSGKTTLMTHVIEVLKANHFTVATIKHHGDDMEDITLQSDKVDHMKHFDAGADQSIVQGKNFQQTVTRNHKQNLVDIIQSSVTINCNFILVEGFKNAPYNKVIVYRDQQELDALSQLSHVVYKINLSSDKNLSDFDKWLFEWIKKKD